jgi:uncharacterized protein (DUF433 family)
MVIPEEDLLSRISVDPRVCFGRPCIRGSRIRVSLILDFLAAGRTAEEILADSPHLVEADIRACIACAAAVMRDRFVDLPSTR